MAERRMFTKKVTDDDNFMALSASAQALYLHLMMSADDDGFSNQVSISMFKAHASVQDLQALLEKRYIYQFDNGVIVIKHWRMSNALRKDRYTPTAFQEELAKLDIKENGSYTWLPNGCQVVATRLPQYSIDKDSIGKDSIDRGAEAPVRSKKTVKTYSEDNSLNEAIKDFIAHRKALKKPMTDKAVDLFLKKLDKMADTSDLKIALINNAIEHGWLSVYPLKDEEKKETGTLVFDIDGFDQSPPFYGMPKEWFENGELVRERIRPVLQKRNDALYITDDILYSEEEVYKKYLRRKEASNAG